MQQISVGRAYFIYSNRVSNPLLHHSWSGRFLNKGDGNTEENGSEDAWRVAVEKTVTKSGRLENLTQIFEF